MRKNMNENPAPSADGRGSLVLPDVSEFGAPRERPAAEKTGHVVGLDYSQWAPALVDLNSREDRIAGERLRLTQKGYRKAGGSPAVNGYPNPEVWVKPRALYEQDRQSQRRHLEDLVARRQMPDSAIVRGILTTE